MTKELQDFNLKVIEAMKKTATTESGEELQIQVPVLDTSDTNIAMTQLYLDGAYYIAFVKLSEDPDCTKPLTDRVEEVLLLLEVPTLDSVTKLNNWLTVIYNQIKVDQFQNKELKDII